MNASVAIMTLKVLVGLISTIVIAVREEQQKQTGRDEIVKAVLKRFKDVAARAEKHRVDAANRIDSDGLPKSGHPFKRD